MDFITSTVSLSSQYPLFLNPAHNFSEMLTKNFEMIYSVASCRHLHICYQPLEQILSLFLSYFWRKLRANSQLPCLLSNAVLLPPSLLAAGSLPSRPLNVVKTRAQFWAVLPTAFSLGGISQPYGFKCHLYAYDSWIHVSCSDFSPKLQTAYSLSFVGSHSCPSQNFSMFSQTYFFPSLSILVNGSTIWTQAKK